AAKSLPAESRTRNTPMKPVRMLFAAIAMLGLAACYTSKTPHLSDENSVAPFAKIAFTPRSEKGEQAVFTREAQHYVTHDGENVVVLHLMPVEDSDYVAQLSGDKAGELLYGYIRISPENAT